MLKTVEYSRAKKTRGIAVTYRAGDGSNYGTCPASCELNPSGCGSSKIDVDYLDAVLDAKPVKGVSFTYSHFSPLHWKRKLAANKTVINYSAKTAEIAAKFMRFKVPCVVTVGEKFWQGKNKRSVDGALMVRCPAETIAGFSCADCGNGDPLCARLERTFAVGFTAHGASKKKAANPDEAGGCYASGGNVALHWTATAAQDQDETDGDKLRRFVSGLPPRSIIRHHIAGDIGEETHD